MGVDGTGLMAFRAPYNDTVRLPLNDAEEQVGISLLARGKVLSPFGSVMAPSTVRSFS